MRRLQDEKSKPIQLALRKEPAVNLTEEKKKIARQRADERRARLKEDPEAYAAYLAKITEWKRKNKARVALHNLTHRERKREEDPEALRALDRHYYENRVISGTAGNTDEVFRVCETIRAGATLRLAHAKTIGYLVSRKNEEGESIDPRTVRALANRLDWFIVVDEDEHSRFCKLSALGREKLAANKAAREDLTIIEESDASLGARA